MCVKLVDPRIAVDGRRVRIDGILMRTWLKNINIGMTTFHRCYKKGMSVTEIEEKYKSHKRAPAKEHTVQYMGKHWTIPELHRSGMCHKSISENALRNRILKHHWDIHRALTQPPRPKRGSEIEYKGKIYDSVTSLCLKLGVSPVYVMACTTSGMELEEAIERASNIRNITVSYKGEDVRIMDLVKYPDNIYNLPYRIIYARINNLNYTAEDALKYPSVDIARNSFNYKGIEYSNKLEYCRRNGIGNVGYNKLMGLDVDTSEFFEALEKLTVK